MTRRVAIFALTFACTLAIRVRGIDRHFWLLGDQIRDWSIALGSLSELPLVGPPTHVRGYTIGPAFYWILWAIRVTVGHLGHDSAQGTHGLSQQLSAAGREVRPKQHSAERGQPRHPIRVPDLGDR